MKTKSNFAALKGCAADEIAAAEEELGLKFAEDYIDFLKAYGIASFEGHEIVGICKSPRLDVVSVTKRMKQIYADAPNDWYVIEDMSIDDVVIWQDSEGFVWQTIPNANPKIIADNLMEYISKQ